MKLTEAQSERLYKDFQITTVCRADLEHIGFDTKDVDDDAMRELASKMADAYCDFGFWESLNVLADEYFEIKKRKQPVQRLKKT